MDDAIKYFFYVFNGDGTGIPFCELEGQLCSQRE